MVACCILTCALLLHLPLVAFASPFPRAISDHYDSDSTLFGIPGRNATFDYVIVGAGTAGLTLATRLVQSGSKSVAVIEAGSFYETDNGNLSVVPSYDIYYTGSDPSDVNPLVDWGFITTAQAVNSLGSPKRTGS